VSDFKSTVTVPVFKINENSDTVTVPVFNFAEILDTITIPVFKFSKILNTITVPVKPKYRYTANTVTTSSSLSHTK